MANNSAVFKTKLVSSPRTSSVLVRSDVFLGIEIEVEHWDGERVSGWQNDADDSLRVVNGKPGQEFMLGPAAGLSVEEAVHEFYVQFHKRKYQSSVRTGIHVHVNMSDRDPEFLLRFISLYSIFERTLFRYAGEWRKWCNFCYPLYQCPQQIEVLHQYLRNGEASYDNLESTRYTSLNVHPLWTLGTVEVRILPTVTTAAELLDWINAILCIYDAAESLTLAEARNIVKNYGTERLANQVLGRVWSSFSEHVVDKDIRRGLLAARALMTMTSDVTASYKVPLDLQQLVGDSAPAPAVWANYAQLEQDWLTLPLPELLAKTELLIKTATGSGGTRSWAKTKLALVAPKFAANLDAMIKETK